MNEKLKYLIETRLKSIKTKLADPDLSEEQMFRIQGNIGALEWVLRESKMLDQYPNAPEA